MSTRPPFEAGGSQCRSSSGVGTNDFFPGDDASDAEGTVAVEDVAATAAAAEGARSASAIGTAACIPSADAGSSAPASPAPERASAAREEKARRRRGDGGGEACARGRAGGRGAAQGRPPNVSLVPLATTRAFPRRTRGAPGCVTSNARADISDARDRVMKHVYDGVT